MFLIIGLGNIGKEYEFTRHNIGFMVIDFMTKNLNTSNINKSNFHSDVVKSQYDLFVKPKTYMNNSGIAIGAIKEYYDIDVGNIIVIHDDLDLPFGDVRFKIGGSHAGHNGLKSIDSHIGKEYIRIRVGIGKPKDKNAVINYVLSKFSQEELLILENIIPHISDSIGCLKIQTIDEVKSKYTRKQ